MLILPQRTQNNAFNIFIWTSLFVGLGMQMCLYSIEWYARQNCPRAVVSLLTSSNLINFTLKFSHRMAHWITLSLDHSSVVMLMIP